jgi:hypothetical protein
MMRSISVSKILFAGLSCFLLVFGAGTGVVLAADTAQDNKQEEQQQVPAKVMGTVTEVINVSGYTYAEVDTGKQKLWAAGPPTELKKGDKVAFSTHMPMQNFRSKSINKTFPVVYFINRFQTIGGEIPSENVHPEIHKTKANEPVAGVEKVEGGKTIDEIYADKKSLNGKTVRVRGKVTKFTPDILGKNWLHIRDSSTLKDLTVTSANTAAIDDVLVFEGKLELDKDYNYGYLYPVILEDAKIIRQ